jgi:Transcriptional regulatory protein, C terminal
VEEPAYSPKLVRFGTFEVDLRAGELWKSGRKRTLAGQPFLVLAMLLERPGEMVIREELQQRLWPDTFVDVEHSLNAAINKIREALNDSAERPHFVETLPRRATGSSLPWRAARRLNPGEGIGLRAANAGLHAGSEECFWIAVLPFKSSGADPELAAVRYCTVAFTTVSHFVPAVFTA